MDVIGVGTYPDEYTRTDVFNLPVPKIAAGADLSFTVPVGILWNVVALSAKFTASAAAANRVITLQVKDQAGSVVYQYTLGAALTANQTSTFTFSEDVVTPATITNGGNVLMPFPSTWLPPLWSFSTSTAAIDTADQWSAVNCWVQAYLPAADE